MLYINEQDLQAMGIEWGKAAGVILSALHCHQTRLYAQPKKLYLRFNEPINRIIAMPAYLGGAFDIAGLKWIASFPKNIDRNLARASSVVILNEPEGGRPVCLINTNLLSIIRTVAVSAVILQSFVAVRGREVRSVAVIGLGPIGLHHLQMCRRLFGDVFQNILAFDIRTDRCDYVRREPGVIVVSSWQEAYSEADVVITCTCAPDRYISAPPKAGSLLLNVSLRDYMTSIYSAVAGGMVVDDWDEVCREDTDVERFHLECGLRREQTRTISDIALGNGFAHIPLGQSIMVNPMGMAIFDIAIAKYYMEVAMATGQGQALC